MRRTLLLLLTFFVAIPSIWAQDTIWVKYNDRFKSNRVMGVKSYDSLEFRLRDDSETPVLRLYSPSMSNGYRKDAEVDRHPD